MFDEGGGTKSEDNICSRRNKCITALQPRGQKSNCHREHRARDGGSKRQETSFSSGITRSRICIGRQRRGRPNKTPRVQHGIQCKLPHSHDARGKVRNGPLANVGATKDHKINDRVRKANERSRATGGTSLGETGANTNMARESICNELVQSVHLRRGSERHRII